MREGLAETQSEVSIRGCKRAVDAIAAGMSQETPGFRALTEAAAFGPDFAEGRAAFAAKRRRNSILRSPGPPTGRQPAASAHSPRVIVLAFRGSPDSIRAQRSQPTSSRGRVRSRQSRLSSSIHGGSDF